MAYDRGFVSDLCPLVDTRSRVQLFLLAHQLGDGVITRNKVHVLHLMLPLGVKGTHVTNFSVHKGLLTNV